jgi:hypothetical protein
LSFLCEDALDFLGEIFVACFLVVEVFGTFRRIVDYLLDLKVSVPRSVEKGNRLALFWSTLSWPDLVRDGPRREYLSVSCSAIVFSSRAGAAVVSSLSDGASAMLQILALSWPSAQRS